jgi:integrase
MASVEKRIRNGQKTWLARWRDPDNKQHKRSFPREVDARRFLTSIEHAKLTGGYVDPAAGKMTLKAYAEEWRAAQVHRPSSVAHVETMLRRHAYPTLGHRPLAAIRPSEVQAWVKRLSTGVENPACKSKTHTKCECRRALAPATVAVVHGIVAAVYKSAVRDRKVTASPCDGVKLPKREPRKVVPPTTETVVALTGKMPDRYKALVTLAAGTGLRQGEAFGLTVDRVDFLRRTVTVDRQLVQMPKAQAVFGPPKTAASYRTIPLPQVVVDALAAHLAQFPAGPDGLIFTTPEGEPLRRTSFSGQVWRPAVAAAAVDGLVFHSLRHYFASLLIRYGESVKVVQARLGHATAAETLDTYSHLWPDSEDRTREAVDAVLGTVGAPSVPPKTAEGPI